MKAVFDSRGASAHQLRLLADWVRDSISTQSGHTFDAIRFIEVDLQRIFPNLGVFIEPDEKMKESRAFITSDPLGIVISESIYNGASNGDLFSTEVILHEVGHLFLHKKYSPLRMNSAQSYESRIRDTPQANNTEWQADMFAKCFMYPYSHSRHLKTSIDIMKTYGATSRQAERISRHFSHLRSKEPFSDGSRDRRWLKRVLGEISSIQKVNEKADIGGQLSLFFKRGKADRSAELVGI